MKSNLRLWIFVFLSGSLFLTVTVSCNQDKTDSTTQKEVKKLYPSDIIASLDQWKILLGNGKSTDSLLQYENDNFFYVESDEIGDWVVYKTPNSGITSRTSSNTRTELGEKKHWTPQTGGNLKGTLKVQHVSTSGDARVAASYSVVVGQIHSDDGHENEPLKIFYKKFPGHEKGSVFWNYEINTEGDNSKRWDYSTAVWGHDMSIVGTSPTTYPEEPTDGIALGEEFSYEVNVYNGIMHLIFSSEGHPTKTFSKSLINSEYINDSDIPEQIRTLYAIIGRDGTETPKAYQGEMQYFKQGAYNQTNGKDPDKNMVWSTGSNIYDGNLNKQYQNGSYTEVWFRESSIGPGIAPKIQSRN